MLNKELLAVEKFKNNDFSGVGNKALVLGIPEAIEEEGIHEGIECCLVVVRTPKHNGKFSQIWVALPKCQETEDLVKNQTPVFIEGKMMSSFSFNGLSAQHQFVVPTMVYRLDALPELPQFEEFFMNYTVFNRIILEGRIVTEPERKYVKSVNNFVTSFKLEYEDATGKPKKINCLLWDSVNDNASLKKDSKVIAISRFTIPEDYQEARFQIIANFNKKDRANKHATYSLTIQRILRTDITAEDVARSLFV